MSQSDRTPHPRAAVIAAIALGVSVGLAAGVGGFTFAYAKGASYFGHDASACANCHVMRGHYDAWLKSSHRSVATCNDCHTPPGFFSKYLTKAENGFWHSFAFTTGKFPEPLRIKARNAEVTELACRGCHASIVHDIDTGSGPERRLSCVRCHRDVGHLH